MPGAPEPQLLLGEVEAALRRLVRADEPAPAVHAFVLPRERAVTKLRQGTPLLHGEPVNVDVAFAADHFERLVRELATQPRARVDALVEALRGGRADPDRLFTEAFVQHADHLSEIAAFTGADPALLSMLATQAVTPLLRAYAAHLRPLLGRFNNWEWGYCPVCGGRPTPAGRSENDAPARYLRCAACDTTWRSELPARPADHPRSGTGFRLELAVPDDEWEGAW